MEAKQVKAKKLSGNDNKKAEKKMMKHSALAPKQFLDAWKRGVKLVGSEFFTVKSDTIDSAIVKWQLALNLEFIHKASDGYSHAKQELLALMCSFYHPEEGQKLLERFGTPNFVAALSVLDFEGTGIVAALCLNYYGW